jgi:hypothetical protein
LSLYLFLSYTAKRFGTFDGAGHLNSGGDVSLSTFFYEIVLIKK